MLRKNLARRLGCEDTPVFLLVLRLVAIQTTEPIVPRPQVIYPVILGVCLPHVHETFVSSLFLALVREYGDLSRVSHSEDASAPSDLGGVAGHSRRSTLATVAKQRVFFVTFIG